MSPQGRVRILIVDDSAVMRSFLRSVISSDPALEVAAAASDGAAALDLLGSAHPDLILLDVEMPKMDGLETLRAIRARAYRMPVIMVSAVTVRGARVTIEALAAGASDYLAKPANQSDRYSAERTLAQDLLPRIHALTTAAAKASRKNAQTEHARPQLSTSSPSVSSPSVLAIGASTGGPAALDVVLSTIPTEFPLPVLVVQHMPELFTGMLVERLAQRCQLQVCEGSEGMAVVPGRIYIARGNWHMELLAKTRNAVSPTLHLHQGPLENHCRPAVDVLFRSVAAIYGPASLCVVLTGMGSDGLAASRLVVGQGGTVLAQDQATSVIWGMPGAVAQAGLASRVLPLAAITPEILRLSAKRVRETMVLS
jgi:two-component system chemotaxis response regulator CheB